VHRFAVEYSEPVAVIDLGWVTYRNDEYVLDLWGLALKPRASCSAPKAAHLGLSAA
jgi:hypothetical protein